ncbi:MAG: DMT family transporter [Roseiflexaceae bacterium]
MALINIIWGVAFPITKPALNDLPPFSFAFLRFVLSLLILLPLAGRSWIALVRGPERWRMLLMGMCGFCLVQVAQTLALTMSPAADISLLSTTSPLWITLLAWPMLGERPDWRGWVGFALAIVGLILVVQPGGATAEAGPQRLIGNLIFSLGCIAWALYNVVGKELMTRYDPLAATTAACFLGTIGLVPFAAWEVGSKQAFHFSMAALLALLYTALLVTVVGFLVLFWAYRRVSAAQVAITMYLQPLAGVVVAWWWLGEPLGAWFIAGAALVLFGVGLVTWRGEPATTRSS